MQKWYTLLCPIREKIHHFHRLHLYLVKLTSPFPVMVIAGIRLVSFTIRIRWDALFY